MSDKCESKEIRKKVWSIIRNKKKTQENIAILNWHAPHNVDSKYTKQKFTEMPKKKNKKIYHCSEIFNIIDESSKQIRNFVIPNEQFDQIDIFISSE